MKLALLPMMAMAHCGFGTPLAVFAAQRGEVVVVRVEKPGRAYYRTCTGGPLALAARRAGSVQPAFTLSAQDYVTPNQGYYLDDTFVYPGGDEGCDVLECLPLPGTLEAKLTAYHLEPERAPPADFVSVARKRHWTGTTAPARVKVIRSAPVTGELEVTVSYFSSARCKGERRVARTQLSVPAR